LNNETIAEALAAFDAAIATGTAPDAPWQAMQTLARTLVGAKLFTTMTIDRVAETARREYTSHPEEYPVSGSKPLRYDAWYDQVHKQHRPFIANTIGDIAKVFPDYETILSLGCGSVVNLPVVIAGDMIGTVNLLDEEHFYTPERVALTGHLSLPAKLAFLAAKRLV
jgi:hypothetical protein